MPELLRPHSLNSIRRALLEGLKPRILNADIFDFDELSYAVALTLFSTQAVAYHQSWKTAAKARKQAKSDYDMSKLMTVIGSLITEGVFFLDIRSFSNTHNPYSDFLYCLTERGVEAVKASSGHPAHPSFIARLRSTNLSMREDVLAALEDAAECLSHGLLRASIVMLGVASETTCNIALDGLAATGKISSIPKRPKAQQVISLLKTCAQAWPTENDKHDLEMAVLGLEILRTERNKAAHPYPVSLDREQAEILLIQQTRHVQDIWRIPIAAAIADGYKVPSE